MGIKEALVKIAERNAEKKRKFKQLEEDFLMRKKLEERQKSANERELERVMNERREAMIKTQLDKYRKEKRRELLKGNSLFNQGASILKEENPILKQKNIFKMKGNMFAKSTILKKGKKGSCL